MLVVLWQPYGVLIAFNVAECKPQEDLRLIFVKHE